MNYWPPPGFETLTLIWGGRGGGGAHLRVINTLIRKSGELKNHGTLLCPF